MQSVGRARKKWHFAAPCKTKKRLEEIYHREETRSIETVFQGVISENSTAVNGEQILLKLDTGAADSHPRKHVLREEPWFSKPVGKKALWSKQYVNTGERGV